MSNLKKRLNVTADTQQMQTLEQKGGEIKQTLTNVLTELQTVITDLQDPTIGQDGTAMGIDVASLSTVVSDFVTKVNTALQSM